MPSRSPGSNRRRRRHDADRRAGCEELLELAGRDPAATDQQHLAVFQIEKQRKKVSHK
jgi:hypothetical protein